MSLVAPVSRSRPLITALLTLAALLPAGCTAQRAAEQVTASQPTPALPQPTADKATDYPGLHNLVVFGDGIVSGSAPEGRDGFASIRALGFKTIVSVDGAEPEVAAAKAEGLRYVHLPIGYNGASVGRQAEIARAIRDLPGPV